MLNSISIHIDKEDSKPLYVQLYEELKKMINNESYDHSEKLPSIRQLSTKLKVNAVTVVNAFRLLENEGYIELRKGSGAYVRFNGLKVINSGQDSLIDELYSSEEVELMKNGEITLDSEMINFASTIPSLTLFPIEDFKHAIIETIEQDGADAFNYQESLGYEPLRTIICNLLKKQNIFVKPISVQVISGAQQGIDIVAKALIKKDDCVVVENPTYLGATAVFKSRGAHIECAEIQWDGIDLDTLLLFMKKYRPKIIYTMPSHQNPTGYKYSIEKRKKLLELATSFGCYIIEDDFLSELNFSDNPLPVIKSMDTNERVIFIKSYSKLLMPGLRIGFMVVPKNIMHLIVDAKHMTDISTSGLIQRAFSRFLEYGMWEKHMDHIRPVYRRRFELMFDGLTKLEKYGINFRRPEGGFIFWVRMPDKVDIRKLYISACKNGIAFIPGSVFDLNHSVANRFLRISFAHAEDEQIEKGMEILEYCVERELNRKSIRSTFPLI